MSGAVSPEDRLAVIDVLVRYATGIDRRDWTLLRSCFTEDCDVDYGELGRWHGADEVTEWMRTTHEPLGHTMHRMTNQVVQATSEGVGARSYVDALVLFAGNGSGTRASGYYDDELVLVGGGWRIAKRTFTMVFLELVTAAWIEAGHL